MLVHPRRAFRAAALLLTLACQPPTVGTPSEGPAAAAHAPERSAHVGAAELAPRVAADWGLPLTDTVSHFARFLVVSDSPIASAAGVDVLDGGGNAIDAVVTVAFVLAVVYPEAGNLGGGGFAVLRSAQGERAALDFRETAPLDAHRDMYRAPPSSPPGAKSAAPSASKEGHLSAGVPGSVAGLWALHERYGSQPWPALLAPAIKLAEQGFPVDARLVRSIGEARGKLERFASTRALLLPGGRAPREGDVLKNPDLARVLTDIAERGPFGFYSGRTADLITREMARGGGIMSRADLERYRPRWRAPIEFRYKGSTIVSMPPPSSGGVALALIASILSGDTLAPNGYHSPEHLHLLAEAMRRAFADRNALLGDPDFVDVPLAALLAPDYGAARRQTVTARATPSNEVAPGLPRPEGNHTTHLAVVDEQGAAVSLTTTINDFFGSGVVVSEAGFLLNDEMDDFTTAPGQPNLFGLVQGEANAIAPDKRMLSSMAPTLVLDEHGDVLAAAGARGGPRIITATWQVLSNVLDFGMNASLAVNAPRLHQQWQPDEIALEAHGFTPQQTTELEARGHTLHVVPDLASAPLILRDQAANDWTGAADPRRGGAVLGR